MGESFVGVAPFISTSSSETDAGECTSCGSPEASFCKGEKKKKKKKGGQEESVSRSRE